MEKQRIKRNIKSCRRLLICILSLFITFCLYSQSLTKAVIDGLLITPSEGQNLYAKEDVQFEVFIPYVKSNQVQIQSPSLPANVSFKQIKKTDFPGGGVKLDIWFSFLKKGNYNMPSLSLIIQGSRRYIKFDQFTIVDNPADMNPRIVIQFSNGLTLYSDMPVESITFPVGEKIGFTINLQYVFQLIQFNYDLPKDSIFTQTQLYEITETKYREKKYSDELIPVSSFEWTGLTKGIQNMPAFKLQVTGYNGYRTDLVMPDFKVNFIQPESLVTDDSNNSVFEDAFEYEEEEEKIVQTVEITEETCKKLVELRQRERNIFYNHPQNVKDRKQMEEELLLPVTEKEFFVFYYYCSIVLIFIFLLSFVILLKVRRYNWSISAATLLICSVAFFIYSQVKKNELYGIFKGGKVSSIPEENAESFSEISIGNRVRVTEQAGKWCYVELGETGGWCLSDNVLLIK